MAKANEKRFLLRINGELFEALERWAAHELRSVNGQIEYLLHEAVRKAGRGGDGPGDKKGPRDTRKRTP